MRHLHFGRWGSPGQRARTERKVKQCRAAVYASGAVLASARPLLTVWWSTLLARSTRRTEHADPGTHLPGHGKQRGVRRNQGRLVTARDGKTPQLARLSDVRRFLVCQPRGWALS